MDEMDDLFGTLRGDAAGFRREVAALRAEIGGPLVSEAEHAGQAIERALTRAILTGKLGFEDLKRLALSVMADIARAAIQSGIGTILGGGSGGGGGGLLALGQGIATSLFGAPGRATGGPVSAGRAYRVGERGPEWFVPTSSGRVETGGGARNIVAIGIAAGLDAKFQVGEPWWWIAAGGRICAYDAATTAALGSASIAIADVRGVLTAPQRTMLDALGNLLAASTAALVAAARDEAGAAGLTSHLLVYLPTVLDAAAPEVRRANVPVAWAAPAFDVLQLEDYDWVTGGRGAETAGARAAMAERLAYPAHDQHYFSGFVLRGEDRAQWAAIADAADAARAAGVAKTFIWALPQVARDGFVHFDGEDAVQAYDAVDFPLAIGREAMVVTEFSTQIVSAPSGHEQRASEWAEARMRYDAGPGVRSEGDVRALADFFRARRGAARAFRFRDPFDHGSAADGGLPGPGDQLLGVGDGSRRQFALVKRYGAADAMQVRSIRLPVADSVRVSVDGIETAAFAVTDEGEVLLDAPPGPGIAVRAGYLFDVPVRFAEDRLEVSRATFLAGELASVPLVEVRAPW